MSGRIVAGGFNLDKKREHDALFLGRSLLAQESFLMASFSRIAGYRLARHRSYPIAKS